MCSSSSPELTLCTTPVKGGQGRVCRLVLKSQCNTLAQNFKKSWEKKWLCTACVYTAVTWLSHFLEWCHCNMAILGQSTPTELKIEAVNEESLSLCESLMQIAWFGLNQEWNGYGEMAVCAMQARNVKDRWVTLLPSPHSHRADFSPASSTNMATTVAWLTDCTHTHTDTGAHTHTHTDTGAHTHTYKQTHTPSHFLSVCMYNTIACPLSSLSSSKHYTLCC